MKRLLLWLGIGAIGAAAWYFDARPGGARVGPDIDTSQPPSIELTSQPPFQLQEGKVTLTPDARYSASGYVVDSPKKWLDGQLDGFRLSWGPNAGDLDAGPPGQRVVGLLTVTEDATLQRALQGLERGQRVRVSGWRCAMERGGRTIGPVKKEAGGGEIMLVFPTELQIGNTVYAPSSLPSGSATIAR